MAENFRGLYRGNRRKKNAFQGLYNNVELFQQKGLSVNIL